MDEMCAICHDLKFMTFNNMLEVLDIPVKGAILLLSWLQFAREIYRQMGDHEPAMRC